MAGVLTILGGSLKNDVVTPAGYTIQVLLVGGGGGGGYKVISAPDQNGGAGGGGGGEVAYVRANLTPGVPYSVSVGAGGGNESNNFANNPGNSSSFGANVLTSLEYNRSNTLANEGPWIPIASVSALGGGGGAHTRASAPTTLFSPGFQGQYAAIPGDPRSFKCGNGGGGSAGNRRVPSNPALGNAPGGAGGGSWIDGGTTPNFQQSIGAPGGSGTETRRGTGLPNSTSGRTGAGGGGGGALRGGGSLGAPSGTGQPGNQGPTVSPYTNKGDNGGSGGAGQPFPLNGGVYGGGGGGGGGQTTLTSTGLSGAGGSGGGGNGGTGQSGQPNTLTNGSTNTGGGGGGGSIGSGGPGASGGSGIVILVIPTPNYPGAYGPIASTPPLAPGKTLLTYTSTGTYIA